MERSNIDIDVQKWRNLGRTQSRGGDQSRGTTTQMVPHLEKEMDQMKKAMEEMGDSIRSMNHVDDLVHITDFSFTASIISYPLPSKFKMPTLDSYDGT